MGNGLGGRAGLGGCGKLTGSSGVTTAGDAVVVTKFGKRNVGLNVVAGGGGGAAASGKGSWHCPSMISLGGKQGGSGSKSIKENVQFLV